MIIHDIIKIKYVECGYLPNFPHYLITDKEMIDAFINNEANYFNDNYPCNDDELLSVYSDLVDAIRYHLSAYLESDSKIAIPNWVYSYMIGSCITETSSQEDKHDLLVMLNLDNTYDMITPDASKSIYKISSEWLKRLPSSERNHRPPTIFGEPHVLKSLRLMTQ